MEAAKKITMKIQFSFPKRVTMLILITAWLTLVHISSAEDWSYSGELGPSTWKQRYPDCGGRRQSPISIHFKRDDNTATGSKPYPVWKNYNKAPVSMKLINNGHTIQLKATPKAGKAPRLEIGSKTYVLDQTHFHWGKKDREGSEHTFNGKRYPLEMHAVHRRIVNGSPASPEEVVVVTILYEISQHKNPGLDRFLKYVSEVKTAETEVEIPPFPADTLIPPFDTYYFYYEGSLTTPPCSEVVTFYIRKELDKVSSNQMELLQVALNEEDEEIAGNFRPIQATNGRTVFYVTN